MQRQRIAGLDVVLTGGSDRDGGGDGPLVVLMHGFGAPGDDLVPLQRVLRVPRDVRFAFPAAPLELDTMPGLDSRAWWMIDMAELQAAMLRGDLHALTTREPAGLDQARARIDTLLASLREALRPRSLTLGGFSQGSMLALDVALRTSQPVDALVLLSSTLLARDVWGPAMKKLAGKPIFQSHGLHDPLLPFAIAEELRAMLAAAGAEVSWRTFAGGHEIPPDVLDAMGEFVSGVAAR
jgi:phospholipase/carboxylesterase